MWCIPCVPPIGDHMTSHAMQCLFVCFFFLRHASFHASHAMTRVTNKKTTYPFSLKHFTMHKHRSISKQNKQINTAKEQSPPTAHLMCDPKIHPCPNNQYLQKQWQPRIWELKVQDMHLGHSTETSNLVWQDILKNINYSIITFFLLCIYLKN